MITTLAYVVFITLTLVFFLGCIIVIRNAIKIESFWKKLRKKIKEENKRQLHNMHSGIQRKIDSIKSLPVHEPSLN